MPSATFLMASHPSSVTSSTLTEIDGDIDIGWSRDTRTQAVLVFLCQCPPGDDIGTCLRASDPFDDCHADDPGTGALAAQSSQRGRAAARDDSPNTGRRSPARHEPPGRRPRASAAAGGRCRCSVCATVSTARSPRTVAQGVGERRGVPPPCASASSSGMTTRPPPPGRFGPWTEGCGIVSGGSTRGSGTCSSRSA